MGATLESLDDLQSWDDYRSFMKERLKQAPEAGCPFFLSKKKVDFDEGGKPWKGFAVLIGPKGLLVVNKVKKEGVLFHEAVCRVDGKAFVVEGFSPLQCKQAHLTLKRLKLGYSVAGGEEGGEEEDDAAAADAGAVKRRLDGLVLEIKRAAAGKAPQATTFLKEAAARAGQADKLVARDPAGARALLDEAAGFLEQAQEAAAAGAAAGGALDLLRTRRQEAVDAMREAAALREPANEAVLKQAAARAKDADGALARQDERAADALLGEVEELLTQVVEGPDDAGDEEPDLAGLGDWKAYRAFLKAQLKRVPPEGGPFYVSRRKVEFDVDGKPYKEHAALLGRENKVKPVVMALKQEGTLLSEGRVVPQGKTLTVSRLKRAQVKGAIKLFVKLRLGWKIVAGEVLPDDDADPDAGEGEGGARPAAAAAPGRTVDRARQGLLSATASWQRAVSTVDGQVAALRSTLKGSNDSDLTQIAEAVESVTDTPRRPLASAIRELQHASGPALPPAVAKVRQALADYRSFLAQDPRVQACDQNPFGVSLRIRATLTPALEELDRALQSANAG